MPKKAPKRTDIVKGAQPSTASFDERFPTIARWISQEAVWRGRGRRLRVVLISACEAMVEIVGMPDSGHDNGPFVRALHERAMVWEGEEQYESLRAVVAEPKEFLDRGNFG
jgi:hypothetical protein